MAAIDIVKAHYAASARGDLDGMVADFAPDIEWVECAGFPTAGTYHGVQAVIEGVFGPTVATWDQFAVHVDILVADGETVIMVGRYTGVNRATGKPLDARSVHVWTVRGAHIVGFEQIADSHVVQLATQA